MLSSNQDSDLGYLCSLRSFGHILFVRKHEGYCRFLGNNMQSDFPAYTPLWYCCKYTISNFVIAEFEIEYLLDAIITCDDASTFSSRMALLSLVCYHTLIIHLLVYYLADRCLV